MKEMKRIAGYYWVELNRASFGENSIKWVLARYHSDVNFWYVTGFSGIFRDSDFLEIGEFVAFIKPVVECI